MDIDSGDPAKLLRALGYPPITHSVNGKTHAWVRYEGEEFSKLSFKAHGCTGELLHAGSGSVEPDWPAPLDFVDRAPLAEPDLIRSWGAGKEEKGRNEQLHDKLVAAKPDSDEWFKAIEWAGDTGLSTREIQQTVKSVYRYRDKTPWTPPEPNTPLSLIHI